MSVYITYYQPPRSIQISFEDLMSGKYDRFLSETMQSGKIQNRSNTQTVCVDKIPQKLLDKTDVGSMLRMLHNFNVANENLRNNPNRQELYHKFKIPKKSGGYRTINAPQVELMVALRNLKDMLRLFMIADHHTAAYAYVEGRCTVDALKKHQSWGSRWFLKLDIHDFFGSTTKDFVIHSFERIYPFNLIMNASLFIEESHEYVSGRDIFSDAIDLAFLDGVLPQGTPVSPFITNVMMIPFDHRVSNKLHNYEMSNGRNERYVYTRYADDMHISCRVDFDWHEIEQFIVDTLKWMNAPFQINQSKTHYGNSNGKNWMLGLMLNKDNEITVGYRRKRNFKTAAFNYLMDRKNGTKWSLEDIQHLQGETSYLKMVEPGTIKDLIKKLNEKLKTDFEHCLIEDLVNA